MTKFNNSHRRQKKRVKLLESKKGRLAELWGVRAQGALIHSRFQSVTQMDTPSKFFFSMERKNGQSLLYGLLYALRSATGQELTKPAEILNCAMTFYSELYERELVYRDSDTMSL